MLQFTRDKMEKITLNKKLVTLASKFFRNTSVYTADVSSHINYRVADSILTDGYKLLSIPNTLPIIADNAKSLALSPIFNWYFYKTYTTKHCIIEADLEHHCYRAVLDNDLIAAADFRTNFPDCDRVLSDYSYNLNMHIENPVGIYNQLATIQAAIKDFNAKQKLKKQPLYNSEQTKVVFSTYYEGGYTFVKAEVGLSDIEFDFALTNQLRESLCLIDYSLPKTCGIDDTFRAGFNFNKLASCFDVIKRVADSKYFNLDISFDTSNSAPIKLTLDNGAWCILIPIKL